MASDNYEVSAYDPHLYEKSMRYGSGNSLQIILKVAERCNIACKYCYFFYGGDESYKDNPAVISEKTCEAFCEFVSDAVRRYNIDLVRIILHGGEPLMMKKSRMWSFLEKLEAAAGPAELQLTIQTNAMLIDDEWIDLFERFNVYVGISLDGPEAINDTNRLDKRGRGTYQRTRAGIDKVFSAHEAGRLVRPGLLCVVNHEAGAKTLYSHFVDEIGFRNIDFLLPDDNHDTITPAAQEGINRFIIELLGIYEREQRSDVRIRFFEKFINSLTMAPFFSTVLHRFYSQKDVVFTVSSAGDIAPDDILRTSDSALMKLGLNVSTATLTDVLLSPGMSRLNDELFSLPSECTGCDWASVCRGGDLYHRYKTGSGFANRSVYCNTLRQVHERLAEIVLHSGVPAELIEKRISSRSNTFV